MSARKGSRPRKVDLKKYGINFDKVFNKNNKQKEKM
jgi:hypothetical protein